MGSPRAKKRDHDSNNSLSDWFSAVRKPPPYRVGGRSFNINTVLVAKMGIAALLLLSLTAVLMPFFDWTSPADRRLRDYPPYNDTYPLTPMRRLNATCDQFRIGIISDLDTNSKDPDKSDTWRSFYKRGRLTVCGRSLKVKWDEESTLRTQLAEKGRGLELSELQVFNGHLYTCDDRTGLVYEVTEKSVKPWVILMDGDGNTSKGFKCEWLLVKDEVLYAGGLGKEWTTIYGEVQHLNPQWVKTIGHRGDVRHHSWVDRYNALRQHAGYQPPGYMIHEAVVWSSVHNEWFFLPRRASQQQYTEEADERRATNILFRVNEDFSKIVTTRMGPLHPTHGFSSFKFIPNTSDQLIVALKSEEDQGKIASYITAFDLEGRVLMPEQWVGDHKFEGIEFV